MVTVLDVNDNGPEFESPYNPMVWENMAPPQAVQMNKTSVLIHAIDRDTSSNAAPFSIRLLMLTSDATNFNLTDFGNGSAAITALRTFDRERQKEYYLPVLMIDSGSPPMSATHTLTVVIGDRNDHPHAPGHTNYIVYSYEGILPTTVLGRVKAPDLDDWSEKVYRFEGKPYRLFHVNQSSGLLSIKEGAPLGSYQLQVRVSDLTWPDVTSTARVEVRDLPQDATLNAASIRLDNVTLDGFFRSSVSMETLFQRLALVLSDLLNVSPENVQVFSVGVASNHGHEASNHGPEAGNHGPEAGNHGHEAGNHGREGLNVWFAARGDLTRYFKPEKIHGYIAANRAKLEAILGVSVSQVGVDDCPITDCAGGCVTDVSFGSSPSDLSNGDTALVSLPATATARCGCRGREMEHKPCGGYTTNPCLNGGTCHDGPLGYRCKCPPMLDGPECQQTRHSFGGHGYAWFRPIMLCFTSHISIDFLTQSADGLLLYNGPLSGEQDDFIAIELKNGVPALSINHGSGTLTLQLPPSSTVTDRRWHRIDVYSDGKAVQLILDQCAGVAVGEEMDESVCKAEGETPGNSRYLNVYQPLQLGGVKEAFAHRRYRSFNGCIRNLVVDSQVFDLASPAESVDSSPGCGLTDGVCVSGAGPSCGAQGRCVADWGSFSCDCNAGFTGHKCDKAVPEFSFASGSVVSYELRGSVSSRLTTSQLMVRTRASTGTLLSVSSRDSTHCISLEIMEGLLSVRADLGDGPHTLQLAGQRLDVGQWVTVSLRRYDNLYRLGVEGGGGARGVTATLGHRREMHHGNLLLGNGPNNAETEDFQGCLRDVRFNGLLLPLDGAGGDRVTLTERRGLTDGCYSDACRNNPCVSPLRCVDLWRTNQCRCPSGQVTELEDSGVSRCVASPCGPSSCRNGGVCVPLSALTLRCRCRDGFRGVNCELGQLRGLRAASLSPSSILAISMCMLVFFSVLVAVTVYNQKGSRNKFRRRGVYHIPAEHQSWEDVRENILNYNEEGGGEQDQNGYDMTELKRPLCSSLSQSSSCTTTTAPLLRSSSQEEVHIPGLTSGSVGGVSGSGGPYSHNHHSNSTNCTQNYARQDSSNVDFKSYVAKIIWEADNDGESLQSDGFHVWCVEGAGSNAGSLSSLGSDQSQDRDCGMELDPGSDNRLSRWGPKFEALSDIYDRPQLSLTYKDALAYIQRGQSKGPMSYQH